MVYCVDMMVLTAVAVSVSSGSPVPHRTSGFSCCDQTVNYTHDLACDDKWSSNEMNFAEISRETKFCESPCKEINDAGIILDKCVNVTVDTVCYVTHVIKETRVTFFGQMCSLRFTSGTTTGNKSSVVLLLLTFLTGQLPRFLS